MSNPMKPSHTSPCLMDSDILITNSNSQRHIYGLCSSLIFSLFSFLLLLLHLCGAGPHTTVIEMVEMVEILDGRLGKRSVERVRYVINNLFHLVIVKYGNISLVLCISTRLRLMTIVSLLVKYLVIITS